MRLNSIIKSSRCLTCMYYIINDLLAQQRLKRGNLLTTSGSRHTDLDVTGSLQYINRIYHDYLTYGNISGFIGNVAEIGPGDNFGVALRILNSGASHVHAIDRWTSKRDDLAQFHIYTALSKKYDLSHFFSGNISENSIEKLTYHSGKPAETFFRDTETKFNAIVSRAVLEHLYDPISALADMTKTLCQNGLMIHRVDLRDHGMFPNFHPLTLLTFSDKVHKYMTVGSGRPNRVLVNQYRDFLERTDLSGNIRITRLVSIDKEFDPIDWKNLDKQYKLTAIKAVNLIRPRLNVKFRKLPDEDLVDDHLKISYF